MIEPVSLAQMRRHLRLADDQTDEDALIQSMITAARRACENKLNRSVVGTVRTATFTGFPSYPYYLTGRVPTREQLILSLPGGVITSVASISYHDSDGIVQTLDPAKFELDAAVLPAALAPVDVWPASYDRPDAVTITYVVSPLSQDDQEVVGQAIRLLVGNWYEHRESVAVDVRGVPTEMPMSVAWLLDPIRVIPFR